MGKESNVLYLVEGNTEGSDPNVEVTAEWIDASSGKQIWTHRYDQQANQPILAFRDDVARAIVGAAEGVLA